MLLEKANKNVIGLLDLGGLTPLHQAAVHGCLKSVETLLEHGSNPSATDNNGQTPLHKATKSGSLECAAVLMRAGSDILQKDDRGVTPKRYLRENPGNLESLLDLGIQMSHNRQSGFPLTFDFTLLVEPYKIHQCRLLENFSKSDCNYLLAHPLSHIFLLVKWRKARIIFLGYLMFFTLFLSLTYVMMLNRFVWAKDKESNKTEASNEFPSQTKVGRFYDSIGNEEEENTKSNLELDRTTLFIIQGIMIFQMAVFSIGQLSRLRHFAMSCMKSVSWWLLNVIIVLSTIIIVQSWYHPREQSEWERHIATIVIMLQGTQVLHIMSKFPSLGIYWLMFVRVAILFMRVFFIYLCLLVTFTMTFYVALSTGGSKGTFDNAGLTFLKSLTMMIGELDLEEMKGDLKELNITSHILLICFILLVSIILSNLLVALAVSDVNELRAIAHLMRLAR